MIAGNMENLSLKHKKYKLTAIFIWLAVLFFIFPVGIYAQNQTSVENEINLHMFYGQGCPHCSLLRSFLANMANKYDSLKISEHEVYQDNEGRELFEKMSKNFNVPIEGVPTVFIDDRVIVGFSNAIGVSIENQIKRCLEVQCNKQ